MKLIIEVTEEHYKHLKDKMHNRKATISDATILDGTPYEERPTSEWHGNNFDEHSCTICGHPALYEEEPDGYYEVQSNFCPNCGAEMMRVKNELGEEKDETKRLK